MINLTPLSDSTVISCAKALSARITQLSQLMDIEPQGSRVHDALGLELIDVQAAYKELCEVYCL